MAKPQVRVKVPEVAVEHRWVCSTCKAVSDMRGSNYADIGMPVCGDCDQDMTYEGTFLVITTGFLDHVGKQIKQIAADLNKMKTHA